MSIRRSLLSAVSALLVLFATVALVPVSISVTPGKPLAGESSPPGWSRIDLPAESTVVIRKTGGPLRLTGVLENPETFDEQLLVAASGFAYDADARTLVADRGPARATLRGNFGDLSLVVDPSSRPGSITAERSSPGIPAQVVEFTGEVPARIDLPSPRAVHQHTSSYMYRSVKIPAQLQGGDVEAAAARESVALPAHAEVVPAAAALLPALKAAATGWGAFVMAVALLAFFWLVGRSLNPTGPRTLAAGVLHTTLGLTLTACIGVSLTYFLPARYSALLILVGAVAVIAVGLTRGALRGALPEVRALGSRILWTTVPATILFFPILFWGTTYAGQYKTDLFFYGTGASIAADHSLLSMQSLPDAQQWVAGFGINFRAIDSVLASLATGVAPLTTVGALVLLGLALFYLFGIAVMGLAAAHNPDSRWPWLPVLVLLNPVFAALFAEDYYSHYWFVALLPGLAMALHALWRSEPGLPVNRGLALWTSAALSAALTAVYPYFFIIVVVAVLLVSLARRAWRSQLWRNTWPLLWRTLLLANLSLITLLGFFKAESEGGERLDEITRYVLLSGYTPAQYVGLLAGFTPYEWRAADIPSTPDMGWPASFIWAAGARGLVMGTPEVLTIAALVLILITRVRWPETLRSFAAVLSITIVAGFAAFAGLYALLGRPYPALKGFWTAAALAALVLAVLNWRRSRQWIVAVVLITASVLWIRTATIDRVTWLMGAKTDPVALGHMSTAQDLHAIARLIREEPGDVVIGVTAEQPFRVSDQRRVLEGNTQVLARDFDRTFMPTTVIDEGFCASLTDDAATIVVIGVSNDAELCGRPLAYRSTVVEVYQ